MSEENVCDNIRNCLIKCPHCGYEYLPAEIYIPDSFLGKPDNIVRDDNGHIWLAEGPAPNPDEEYRCDNCGCLFSIHGNIEFKTSIIQDSIDEDDMFVVSLK